MKIDRVTLENNLNTLFIDSSGSTAATVQIWFRAGSALESKDEQGIAHFLEHMFFKGTPKRPGAQIAHDVESFGGELNAFTSFDYTCYYINTPNDHLKETVEILLDMVSNPQFLEEDLIPERDVVFEEYRRSQDNPSQFNFQKIQEACFTDGYQHGILGPENNIKRFSRHLVTNFRNKFYNLENSLFVVAGDLSMRTEIEKVINSYKIPNGLKSRFPEFKLKDKSKVEVHQKDVRQTVLTMCIQAPAYTDKEASAEDLALSCLAHGETSILFKNLIADYPTASSTSGSTMYFVDGGCHFLRLVFPHENTEQVKKIFLASLNEKLKNPFTNEEIEKIKNQYIASKVYEKESLEAYAFSLGHGFAQDGNIFCEDEFINRIKKTSATQVNQALNDILNREIHFILQIPKEESIDKTKKSFDDLKSKIKKLKTSTNLDSKAKTITSKYDPATHIYELSPGVKLVHRYNSMTPTFVFHAYMKGGLQFENAKNSGSHYILGRSLTYGYKGKKYEDLKLDLENKSANLSGFSGKNAYGLTLHGQIDHKNALLKHFFSTLIEPTIPTKFVNLEKKLIERTLENQKEDPIKHCFKTFNELIFQNHHYNLDLIGNASSIKGINSTKLLKLHNDHLNKSEIVFTFCGDSTANEVIDLISPYLKKFKPRKFTKTKIKNFKSKLGLYKKIEFNREQSQIFIGTKGFNITQIEDIYLKMITAHLSGQSSELFVDVRDRKGLCYAVQPIHHSSLEGGYWGIYIGAGKDKTKDAIDAINEIIQKTAKNGLSVEEFERTKKMMSGNALLSIQTNDDYANIYSVPVLHSIGIDHVHQINEDIKHIKYNDFNNFIKKFFSSKWNTIEVGPTV